MSGIVRRAGWEIDEEGEKVFRTVVDYPNGPPNDLTFAVVWNEMPVAIVVVRNETMQGVGTPDG